jgi:hypothetical protein
LAQEKNQKNMHLKRIAKIFFPLHCNKITCLPDRQARSAKLWMRQAELKQILLRAFRYKKIF